MLWSILSLILVLLITGSLLAVITAYLMALTLLRPRRMTDGRAAWRLRRLSPGDLHLAYSECSFKVNDERTGHPRPSKPGGSPTRAAGCTVLLLHGYGDAKVGSIAWAPTLHNLNLNILALDLRAHGESEGRYTTAGVRERYDVSQVIDQLKRDQPAQTSKIILFGISLGAAVAAATAVLREDIAAVILECPFPDFELAARSHAAVLGGPGPWLQSWSFAWAQRIADADFSTVRPSDLIPRINCPVMVIRSDADVFIDDEEAAPVEAAAKRRSPENTVYWNAENAHHVAALAEDPVEYQRRIREFLGPVLDLTTASADPQPVVGTAPSTASDKSP